jgi:hypothetical protein
LYSVRDGDARTYPPEAAGGNFKLPALRFSFEPDEYEVARIHTCLCLLFGGNEVKNRCVISESLGVRAQQRSVKFPSDMTPPTKTRFEMLLGTKEHEMHHRGQLMLIERMLGIVPHLTRPMQERMAMASTVSAR